MRTSICWSWQAHSGWALATAPSAANRGRSSGWTIWMWARCGRVSVMPFAARAASTASSGVRTARSPRAWKCGCSPSGVEAGTLVLQRLRIDGAMPRFVGRLAARVEVRVDHRAVNVSATPSIISFTLLARSRPGGGRAAVDELVDLLAAAVALPPQRALDPGGQSPRSAGAT